MFDAAPIHADACRSGRDARSSNARTYREGTITPFVVIGP